MAKKKRNGVEELLHIYGIQDDFKEKLGKIAYYISQSGLPLEEACIMADMDEEIMKRIMNENVQVRNFIRKKEITYKAALMKTVSEAARMKDPDMAISMLGLKYPDEFGNARYRTKKQSEDPLQEIIKAIQQSGTQNNGLVKPQKQNVENLPGTPSTPGAAKSIHDILK